VFNEQGSDRVKLKQPEVVGNSQIRGGRDFHCLPERFDNDHGALRGRRQATGDSGRRQATADLI
jgi:hypothetical protein